MILYNLIFEIDEVQMEPLKNACTCQICKDNREVEGIQFDEHGFECARRYSGNVVDGIGSDLPDMKYRELGEWENLANRFQEQQLTSLQ